MSEDTNRIERGALILQVPLVMTPARAAFARAAFELMMDSAEIEPSTETPTEPQ